MAKIRKHKFDVEDIVYFNVAFSNADGGVEPGDLGIIKSLPGRLGLYGVLANRQIWLVKENEIRKSE